MPPEAISSYPRPASYLPHFWSTGRGPRCATKFTFGQSIYCAALVAHRRIPQPDRLVAKTVYCTVKVAVAVWLLEPEVPVTVML